MSNISSNMFLFSNDQNFGFTTLSPDDFVITETSNTVSTKYEELNINLLRNDVKINEPPTEYIWKFFQENITKNIQDYICINDEEFKIEKEDGTIYLTHPRWSLVGMGYNLKEAINDLLQEAKELFEDLKNIDLNSLSSEAFQMRDYLFKII